MAAASIKPAVKPSLLEHPDAQPVLSRLGVTGSLYAGGLVTLLHEERERARQARNEANVRDLELQVEDVEEFRQRIEAIERGDELKYRIRCRRKGEEETGRPGPYAPDIDDGVKVNIRPSRSPSCWR